MSAPLVLVTGGTGFVGSALVPRLAQRGGEVHVLARASSTRDHLDAHVATWHTGDLLDAPSVGGAVHAAAARAAELAVPLHVVHSAALISYRTADAELARRVNVEGTRIVLDACQAVGAARVCFVSSVVAVGDATGDEVVDEDTPFNGARLRTHYVTTKRAAEDFCLSVAKQLDVVVVNPGAIFGPSPQETNTQRFLRMVAAREVGPLAPPGSLSVVGVDDVAAGIELALERGRRGRRYLLCESNVTMHELLSTVAAELGVRPPFGRVPPWLWSLVVAGAVPLDRLRPSETATPQALRLLGVHYRTSAVRAREELGWSPRPFAEVLSGTIAWMREHGRFAGASGGRPDTKHTQ